MGRGIDGERERNREGRRRGGREREHVKVIVKKKTRPGVVNSYFSSKSNLFLHLVIIIVY